jgi:uncharacterized protein (TIGR00255 family)
MRSMTGFGKFKLVEGGFEIVCEIKSVNHRFRDVRFKMSSSLNELQMKMRKYIEVYLKRGSIDIYIQTKSVKENPVDSLDKDKINKFISSFYEISQETNAKLTLNPCQFLRNEFTLSEDDNEQTKKKNESIYNVFCESVKELENYRIEEGIKTKHQLEIYLTDLKNRYAIIKELNKTQKERIKEKLNKKFEEVKSSLKVDEERFNQELIYYLEKQEVQEEIDRLEIHLDKFLEVMLDEKLKEKGRKLEFLTQEIHRETNTISSKIQINEVLENTLEMKVLIEKLREQTLNIE